MERSIKGSGYGVEAAMSGNRTSISVDMNEYS